MTEPPPSSPPTINAFAAAAAAHAIRERAAQGLGPTITDPEALRRIAALLRRPTRKATS